MLRPACVNIPYLALQLLLKKNPEWRSYPAAVVSEDKPNGIVTELNREAARAGIRGGMRYAAALSLSAELRASVVTERERNRGVEEIEQLLADFTPEVEPCPFDVESFWLNASGLTTLYRSLLEWSKQLSDRLNQLGLYSRIAIGFTRFGSYAAAKTQGGAAAAPVLFESFEEEKRSGAEVPISVLPIPHEPRAVLEELGIRNVRQLFDLPRAGLKKRFGEAFEQFYDFLEQGTRLPIQPRELAEEIAVHRNLPSPIARHEALSYELEGLIAELTRLVRSRGQQMRELIVTLFTEEREEVTEQLKPAQPTTDSGLLHRLLTCRLENTEIEHGVVRIELTADRVAASKEQFALFQEHGSRDIGAAARAFARLRAQLGNDAVQRAVLLNEHAPERQFSWHSILAPAAPQSGKRFSVPESEPHFPLIRRIYHEPIPLSEAEAGAMFASDRASETRSATATGPFRYSGLWWNQHPLERSYYFVHTRSGQIRWLFYDTAIEQWMLTGIVD